MLPERRPSLGVARRLGAWSFCMALVVSLPCLLASCSTAVVSPEPLPESKVAGKPLASGFSDSAGQWETKATRYVKSLLENGGLYVQNSQLATGISPIWYLGAVPRDFDLLVGAELVDEGVDGGWGIEFGAKERRYAYRVLVYASGRFCIDRLFDTYPEFIHCVSQQPEVSPGEGYSEIRIRVAGFRVRVFLNGKEVVAFDDDRYEAGDLALAASGANARLVFSKFELAAGR